jgi:hypothetical protein
MSSLRSYRGSRTFYTQPGFDIGGLPVIGGKPFDTGQPNGQSPFGPRISAAQVYNSANLLFSGGTVTIIPASDGKPTGAPSQTTSSGYFGGFGDEDIPPHDGSYIYDYGPNYQHPHTSGYYAGQGGAATCPTSQGGKSVVGNFPCGCGFRRIKVTMHGGSKGGGGLSTIGMLDTGSNASGGMIHPSIAQQLGINYRSLRSSPFSTEQKRSSVAYGPINISITFDPNPSPVSVKCEIVDAAQGPGEVVGQPFSPLPMAAALKRVQCHFTKHVSQFKSVSGGQIVTYDCDSGQITQGDPEGLWPKGH